MNVFLLSWECQGGGHAIINWMFKIEQWINFKNTFRCEFFIKKMRVVIMPRSSNVRRTGSKHCLWKRVTVPYILINSFPCLTMRDLILGTAMLLRKWSTTRYPSSLLSPFLGLEQNIAFSDNYRGVWHNNRGGQNLRWAEINHCSDLDFSHWCHFDQISRTQDKIFSGCVSMYTCLNSWL